MTCMCCPWQTFLSSPESNLKAQNQLRIITEHIHRPCLCDFFMIFLCKLCWKQLKEINVSAHISQLDDNELFTLDQTGNSISFAGQWEIFLISSALMILHKSSVVGQYSHHYFPI